MNLHSDILDTPEWFWEADLWEPRYGYISIYIYTYLPVVSVWRIAPRLTLHARRLLSPPPPDHPPTTTPPPSPQINIKQSNPQQPTTPHQPNTQTHQTSYGAFCKYLDLPNRINILNKRLDILRELLNVLETQLDNSHSTKLELIVIALIIVEVVLQVLEIALNDLFHVGSGGTFI